LDRQNAGFQSDSAPIPFLLALSRFIPAVPFFGTQSTEATQEINGSNNHWHPIRSRRGIRRRLPGRAARGCRPRRPPRPCTPPRAHLGRLLLWLPRHRRLAPVATLDGLRELELHCRARDARFSRAGYDDTPSPLPLPLPELLRFSPTLRLLCVSCDWCRLDIPSAPPPPTTHALGPRVPRRRSCRAACVPHRRAACTDNAGRRRNPNSAAGGGRNSGQRNVPALTLATKLGQNPA